MLGVTVTVLNRDYIYIYITYNIHYNLNYKTYENINGDEISSIYF